MPSRRTRTPRRSCSPIPTGVVVEANPAAAALGIGALGVGTEALLGVGNGDLVEGRSPQTARLRAQDDEKRDFRLSVSHLGPAEDGALRQVVLEDLTEDHRASSEARAWAGELLRAQEDERRRIAQDIHDDPLQRLMLLARQMAGLGSAGCSGEEADGAFI